MEPILALHDFVTVPGIGHSTNIYTKPEARPHIFMFEAFFAGFDAPCPDPCPDWSPSPDDMGGDLVMSGGDLVPSGTGTSARVYRRLDFDKPMQVRAVIGDTDDLSLTGGRFAHHFMVLSDGNRSSGYGFAVERSGSGSSDSRVTVYDNGAQVASINSTFQFVEELEIEATIFTDGRVEGSIVEGSDTFTFAFGAYGFRSTGHQFLYHTDWNAPGSTKPPRLEWARVQPSPLQCPDAPSAPDGDGDGTADDCDNCVATMNGAQDDIDLDGVGDACDNCPAGYNPRQGAAVFSQTLHFDDVDTLSWATPTDVEVLRGDLASVSSYAFDYAVPHMGASTYVDATVPPLGDGYYFLLKPGGTCASPSWQTLPGEEPQRDATLP